MTHERTMPAEDAAHGTRGEGPGRAEGATSATTADVIRRFNDAFLDHQPGTLPALVADGCVIENTGPAPDGSRHVGREACLAVWEPLAASTDTRFELEDVTFFDDRAIVRWRFRWGVGAADSRRGVNLMRVRDGLIVEACGYVKGT